MKEEEEVVKKMVMDIVRCKPDLVITEKGISGNSQSLTSLTSSR
jgi:hypothetical protein